MTERKLILPAEVKVCATCSYWDGERTVDTELRIVVVAQSCDGMCLVREKCCHSLLDVRSQKEECFWEHLAPDQHEETVEKAPENTGDGERQLQTGT